MARIEAKFDDSGLCRIISSGRLITSFPTVYEPAFNGQYPPPASPDGKVLYVGTWTRGLHCYEVSSGKLLWRKGPGKVRHIFPVNGAVVTEMADRGLYRRDQTTGELTGQMKMAGISFAQSIGPDRIFAGPFRRKYLVVEIPELKPVAQVAEADLNPDDCLSLMLLAVAPSSGSFIASGWEEYPDRNFNARGVRKFNRKVVPSAV